VNANVRPSAHTAGRPCARPDLHLYRGRPGLNPASEIPTYHSAVSEVRITFFATDDNNHSVATLSKSDVAVVDDEHVVRNFRNFTHSEETSLDVVALVDLSESVAPATRPP